MTRLIPDRRDEKIAYAQKPRNRQISKKKAQQLARRKENSKTEQKKEPPKANADTLVIRGQPRGLAALRQPGSGYQPTPRNHPSPSVVRR
jgi:hypothetical protein